MTDTLDQAMSTGQFAQLVAEIEVAELERGAAIAPVFLWLWEHRVQVRGLLTAGTSWAALAAALGRIGIGDARGAAPSVEHCRAAWGRVVAFEPLVAGRSLERPAVAASAPAPAPPPPVAVAESAPRAAPAVAGGAGPAPAASPAGMALGEILAQRRRSALADPPPLDLAVRDRRPRRDSMGDMA
ncbi:hypothetical protein [Falsiroseomonas selenitidurans]|uniref:Uncharacterized protein n=1 Tax=Falsiroseomonas selenitidurans TaxID=2716335 RepID=A0ABX1E887_9PROT|nr:hypothetical protein [Falsiroseomonas selenitidurans]NKC33399.1 hypothetical protein [Falsiroseomonas selenitidurans]